MKTDHPNHATGSSQAARILAALERANGAWVPMPELVRLSGAYAVHSRVSDLRLAGWQVRHRNIYSGRKVFSEYRLEKPATNQTNKQTK